jgi:hypothetical protein
MVTMTDENALDSELSKWFAQAHQPLADGEFLEASLVKIERAQRIRLWRRILLAAAALIVASLTMPMVLEKTSWMARSVGEFPPAYGDLLITPVGWAVSMIIGICVVLRTRPSRR